MQIIPSLLFGISASLDALLVGISYGIRGARIRFWQNLLISLITLAGTCLSVGLGAKLTYFLPDSALHSAGSVILILFGLYYIIKFMINQIKKYRKDRELTATQCSGEESSASMTLPEACALGCALSANNMGIGLSASIAGLQLLPAATVTFLFSLSFLYVGNRLGRCRILRLAGCFSDLLSGLLLVLLGILE